MHQKAFLNSFIASENFRAAEARRAYHATDCIVVASRCRAATAVRLDTLFKHFAVTVELAAPTAVGSNAISGSIQGLNSLTALPMGNRIGRRGRIFQYH